MQNRKRGKVWALNDNINDSTVQDFRYTDRDPSEHSKEYEEPQTTDQFRHWSNLVWNVSNSVTTRLRDFLVNKPKSQTKTGSNNSSEEGEAKGCQDEGNTSCKTSSDTIMESSNQIDDEICDRRLNHRRQKSASCAGRKSHHLSADDRLKRQGVMNRVNMSPFVVAHGIPSHPPVLILPRLHHGSTRRSTHSGFYKSGHHVQGRGHCKRDDKCGRTNSPYQHRHHPSGRQRKCKASHVQENLSFLSDAQQTPEKLGSLNNGLRISEKNTTEQITQTTGCKVEHDGQRYFRKLKHSSRRIRDFDSENYTKGSEPLTPSHGIRDSLEGYSRIPEKYGAINISQRNVSNHQFRFIGQGHIKKMAWDLQYAGVPLKHNSFGISSRSVSTSPCTEDSSSQTSRDIEKQSLELQDRTALDRDETDFTSSLRANYESVELPIKESAERQNLDPPSHVTDASVKDSKIADKVDSPAPHFGDAREKRHCKITKETNNAPDNGCESSTMTENSVDALLRNLRGRMDALADIYPPDVIGYSDSLFRSIDRDRREKIGLSKRCTVGSCLTRTYHPPSLERKPSKVRIHFEGPPEEEARPSFSDRIRDVWRYGESRVCKSSPRHNVKPEKELSLKLSVHGLNQQPVLREYSGEHNNTAALTRILEKLIDSKTKTQVVESPKPLPRLSRKRSETNLQLVDVGVQKSMPMSTTCFQNFVPSSKYRLLQEQKSGSESLRKICKQIPIETPRPLHVFSGDSVIPISSILMDTHSSYNRYQDPNGVKGQPVIVDDPVIRENERPSIIGNQFLRSQNEMHSLLPSKCKDSQPPSLDSAMLDASTLQQSCSIVEAERGIKNANKNETNQESIDDRKRLLSLTLKKTELGHQRPEARIRSDPMEFRNKGSKFVKEKGCSGWLKTFPFGKSTTLKRKIASFLNYVSTKRKCKTHYYHSQKHNRIDKVITRDIAPTPPIRKRRRPPGSSAKLAVRSKSSKSIQWELNTSVQPTLRVDVLQMQESQQTDEVISEILVARKITMTCGTNTVEEKSHIFSSDDSKKFPSRTQHKEMLLPPNDGIIAVSDDSYQPHVQPDINASIEKDSRTSSSITNDKNNLSSKVSTRKHQNNSESKLCTEQATPNSLEKFKVSCSLSSKIPTAIKPVTTSNFSSITHNKRPSTAPSLDKTTSEFSQSEALLGAAGIPSKTSGTESAVGQETRRKMLFKHNRSSLLRINNSTSRRCMTGLGSLNLSGTITTGKNLGRKTALDGFTSCVTCSREKSPEISLEEKNQCLEKLSESPAAVSVLEHNTSTEELTDGKFFHTAAGTSALIETKDSTEKPEEYLISSPARQKGIDLKYLGNFEFHHLREHNNHIPLSDIEYSNNRRKILKELTKLDEVQDDTCEFTLVKNEDIVPSNILEPGKSSLKYRDESVRFKSIPTSRVSPLQFGTAGEKIAVNVKLPRKRTKRSGLVIARFPNPPNGESNVSPFESNKRSSEMKELRLQIRTVKTINSEEKLTTICKDRNKTNCKKKILELIMHKLLDAATRGSIRTRQLSMNAKVQVSSNKIIDDCVTLNSEKFSSTGNEKFFVHLEDDGNKYFPSTSLNEKQEFRSLCCQKEIDNWSKRVTVNAKSCMEAVPMEFLKIDNYLSQSIIVFDLAEIIDTPVTFRPSIFNVRLKAKKVFEEGKVLKVFGGAGEEGFQDGRLSDANSNLRLMNDENLNKSLKYAKNVKIDKKVLEKKVKCSAEIGVPLKTITIIDSSRIRRCSLMNNMNLTTIHDVDSKETLSEVDRTSSKNFVGSQEIITDSHSEQRSSLMIWSTHEKNRNEINVPKSLSQIRSQLLVDDQTEGEVRNIIGEGSLIMQGSNLILILSGTGSQSKKKLDKTAKYLNSKA